MTYRDNLPDGYVSCEAAQALIVARADRYLDDRQLAAVMRRRGVRRSVGVRTYLDVEGRRITGTGRVACWLVSDIARLLPWLRRADDRLLDEVPPESLPTIDEIRHRAEMLRGLRAMAGDAEEPPGWEPPRVRFDG